MTNTKGTTAITTITTTITNFSFTLCHSFRLVSKPEPSYRHSLQYIIFKKSSHQLFFIRFDFCFSQCPYLPPQKKSNERTQLAFKDVVDMRGGDFKNTVYCFGEEEGEVYALCRWCRARKYIFEDIMMMVEEATKCRSDAMIAEFYPDPKSALGCDTALYSAQYPQVYSGFAKNGSPLYFSKVGCLDVEAIECITTVSSIVEYHWHVMMHDFATRLRSHKKNDPQFNKFECVVVMDLANLTMSQLGSKSLSIVKEQSAIDSLCFPETLNKMYIINSPLFFSATWSIIKGWLDPRTANKVEVISSRKTWEKALLEYADADQVPSDYGGTGPNTQDTIEKETFTGKLKRMHSEMLYVR